MISRPALWELGLGVGLGVLLGLLGYRCRLLSRSGLIATGLAIILTFGLGGWVWGVLLLTFFVSAGLWSRYRAPYKRGLSDRFMEGWSQNALQIMARIGWALLMVILYRLDPRSNAPFAAFVGAIAAATADTWATEIGVLSTRAPRLITNGRRVRAGTPGAISLMGLVAVLGGSWLIGFLALILSLVLAASTEDSSPILPLAWLPLAATLGGLAGSLVDSLLGATAQGIYYCERCERITETRVHLSGHKAQQIRGWTWLTNDGVNFVGVVVGAAVTVGVLVGLA